MRIAGFFRDSLKALPKNCNPEKIILLKDWLAQAEETQTKQTVAMIFHVTRCGSTLLCQNLKATGHFLVLGEPTILGNIYNQDNIISTELRKQVVQKVVGQWSHWAKQQDKMLVIKTTSVVLPFHRQIRQDLSSCKALFLYREPVAVTESLTRKPPSFLRNYFADLDKHFSQEAQSHYPEKNLQAMQAYRVYIKEIPSENSINSLSLDYEELGKNFIKIMDFFRQKQQLPKNRLIWQTHYYSKSRSFEKKTYTPTSKKTLSAFEKENNGLLAPLKTDYEKLRGMLGIRR